MINGSNYHSSSGKVTPIEELPYPHLINAYNKAKKNHDTHTAEVLEAEIQRRPAPNQ